MRMFALVGVAMVGAIINGLLEGHIGHTGHYFVGFFTCIGMDIVHKIMTDRRPNG